MAFKKVALVGANGTLGTFILKALLSAKIFNVTVLSRASSKSTYSESVNIVTISDDASTEELATALTGQDAVVVAFAGSIIDLQLRLADAAVLAGVKRFIPADFGSCDSSSPRALALMPLYVGKQKVRHYLQKLSGQSSLSWTSLVCGHFFDHGLESGLLGFDLAAKKAKIFDGGDINFSTTTLDTIGRAVVQVLQKEEETKNRMLYIQSFGITQNELFNSLQKAMGQGWHAESVDSDVYIKSVKAETDKDPSNSTATEDLVGVVGVLEANWESKDDFANSLLGLDGENLDQAVRQVCKDASAHAAA
ncbi:NmrA-like family protein [Microthyrium microscopicum]|uniref:NmrA-like family protein n=1 Tax=Microthyrium microscopicum TaxID=703497 RepID=A0A6A6UGW1_9PEZI|nr:NmrA-like family protein [Microthyrium microscopicum]